MCLYDRMRTTLDLPDALLKRAKIVAAQTDMTLKELISRALERDLDLRSNAQLAAGQHAHILDPEGIPCLPPRGAQVNNDLVNRIRDEQGI